MVRFPGRISDLWGAAAAKSQIERLQPFDPLMLPVVPTQAASGELEWAC